MTQVQRSSTIPNFRVSSSLNRHGYKRLGMGMYGMVYQIPNNDAQVVKITTSCTDGWPMYITWAMQHPGPHVPRISSVKAVKDPENEWRMYAVMEKLSPLRKHPKYMEMFKDLECLRGQFRNYTTGHINQFSPFANLPASFMQVVKELGDFGRNNQLYGDLHDENIMFRPSTEELVITDPFSNFNGSTTWSTRLSKG